MVCSIALLAAVTLGTTKVGVAINPATPITEASFYAAVRDAIRLGVDGLQVSAKWSELEPRPGEFVTKSISDAVGMSKLLGADVSLTIQTIDTNQRTLPADLMTEPWNSPKMTARWQALLTAVGSAGGGVAKWISLGNEVDGYLDERPKEIEPYLAFLAEGRRAIRTSMPQAKVGVTTMFNNIGRRPESLRKLNEGMDVTFFTYYPLRPDFAVRPLSDVPRDFDNMASLIPDRPVVLQEIGYPASDALDSSDQKQAEFVSTVLAALKRHTGRFAFGSFFSMHDFSKEQLDGFAKYYGVEAPRFREFLGTLGLRKSDGTPRPAWAVLKTALAR